MISENGNRYQSVYDNEDKYVVQSNVNGNYIKVVLLRYESCIAIGERQFGEERFEFRREMFDPEDVVMKIRRIFLMADEKDFFLGKYKRLWDY